MYYEGHYMRASAVHKKDTPLMLLALLFPCALKPSARSGACGHVGTLLPRRPSVTTGSCVVLLGYGATGAQVDVLVANLLFLFFKRNLVYVWRASYVGSSYPDVSGT